MGDEPALYQIRVSGHLGPILLTAFPAFVPEWQGAETVLTGLLPSTAALYGVLAEVEALGLDLLGSAKSDPSIKTRSPREPTRPWRAHLPGHTCQLVATFCCHVVSRPAAEMGGP